MNDELMKRQRSASETSSPNKITWLRIMFQQNNQNLQKNLNSSQESLQPALFTTISEG